MFPWWYEEKNISILLFCGIFLWCGALACAAAQSDLDILSHNLCFLGGMRKKFLYSYFVVFSLMRGISLRIRAVWSGRSFSAYLVFTYATKIPFLMSQYLYKYSSRFTWNVVLLNIIKQNHCEICRQAQLQIRKIFSYFSMNIYWKEKETQGKFYS